MEVYYTDYPISELGDEDNVRAPIRECKVVGWDGDKYVSVLVEGVSIKIKRGYVYTKYGRLGEVPIIPLSCLNNVI